LYLQKRFGLPEIMVNVFFYYVRIFYKPIQNYQDSFLMVIGDWT